MATSYSNKGSSLAQRVSTQFEQQFGRPANAGGVIDPQFVAWSPGAIAKLQADDKAALERTKRNWNRVTKAAYAAEALLAAGVVAPALAGAGTRRLVRYYQALVLFPARWQHPALAQRHQCCLVRH